jgi:uncharacterized zinc-type alcohol dehydrogenase-like protein
MSSVRAFAAFDRGAELRPYEFEFGPLGERQVEIAVEHCGICHSDLSMLDNDWGRTSYPFVPGHEVVGRVVAVGDKALRVKVGDRVGVGWFSGACLHCERCVAGDQHLCANKEETLIGRPGGFAERIRCDWIWATPVPEGLDVASVGPMFCGGITVFNPILQCGVLPTDRVGVVGIGGLGHLAVKFLRAWGCHVTAFTSTMAKRDEAMAMGAHRVVPVGDKAAVAALAGQLDFLLITVNVSLDWSALLGSLAAHGRMHVVGAVLEPMAIPAFGLIGGAKSLSGSPLGSPSATGRMLDFSARHGLNPIVERFPIANVNDALEHLRAGKARYRVVLDVAA